MSDHEDENEFVNAITSPPADDDAMDVDETPEIIATRPENGYIHVGLRQADHTEHTAVAQDYNMSQFTIDPTRLQLRAPNIRPHLEAAPSSVTRTNLSFLKMSRSPMSQAKLLHTHCRRYTFMPGTTCAIVPLNKEKAEERYTSAEHGLVVQFGLPERMFTTTTDDERCIVPNIPSYLNMRYRGNTPYTTTTTTAEGSASGMWNYVLEQAQNYRRRTAIRRQIGMRRDTESRHTERARRVGDAVEVRPGDYGGGPSENQTGPTGLGLVADLDAHTVTGPTSTSTPTISFLPAEEPPITISALHADRCCDEMHDYMRAVAAEIPEHLLPNDGGWINYNDHEETRRTRGPRFADYNEMESVEFCEGDEIEPIELDLKEAEETVYLPRVYQEAYPPDLRITVMQNNRYEIVESHVLLRMMDIPREPYLEVGLARNIAIGRLLRALRFSVDSPRPGRMRILFNTVFSISKRQPVKRGTIFVSLSVHGRNTVIHVPILGIAVAKNLRVAGPGVDSWEAAKRAHVLAGKIRKPEASRPHHTVGESTRVGKTTGRNVNTNSIASNSSRSRTEDTPSKTPLTGPTFVTSPARPFPFESSSSHASTQSGVSSAAVHSQDHDGVFEDGERSSTNLGESDRSVSDLATQAVDRSSAPASDITRPTLFHQTSRTSSLLGQEASSTGSSLDQISTGNSLSDEGTSESSVFNHTAAGRAGAIDPQNAMHALFPRIFNPSTLSSSPPTVHEIYNSIAQVAATIDAAFMAPFEHFDFNAQLVSPERSNAYGAFQLYLFAKNAAETVSAVRSDVPNLRVTGDPEMGGFERFSPSSSDLRNLPTDTHGASESTLSPQVTTMVDAVEQTASPNDSQATGAQGSTSETLSTDTGSSASRFETRTLSTFATPNLTCVHSNGRAPNSSAADQTKTIPGMAPPNTDNRPLLSETMFRTFNEKGKVNHLMQARPNIFYCPRNTLDVGGVHASMILDFDAMRLRSVTSTNPRVTPHTILIWLHHMQYLLPHSAPVTTFLDTPIQKDSRCKMLVAGENPYNIGRRQRVYYEASNPANYLGDICSPSDAIAGLAEPDHESVEEKSHYMIKRVATVSMLDELTDEAASRVILHNNTSESMGCSCMLQRLMLLANAREVFLAARDLFKTNCCAMYVISTDNPAALAIAAFLPSPELVLPFLPNGEIVFYRNAVTARFVNIALFVILTNMSDILTKFNGLSAEHCSHAYHSECQVFAHNLMEGTAVQYMQPLEVAKKAYGSPMSFPIIFQSIEARIKTNSLLARFATCQLDQMIPIPINFGVHLFNIVFQKDFLLVCRYSETQPLVVKSESTDCPMCLEAYKPTDLIIYTESCHHLYHLACSTTWFDIKPTCPFCREMVV